jgi:hypothetical protein
VAGDEVGVGVRVDDADDGQAVGGRVREVLRHVAPWVDHHRAAGHLVAHEVGSLERQSR